MGKRFNDALIVLPHFQNSIERKKESCNHNGVYPNKNKGIFDIKSGIVPISISITAVKKVKKIK